MSKKLLLLIAFVTIGLTSYAQTTFTGWTIKAGANLSTIVDKSDINIPYQYKVGFTAGIAFGWAFTDVVGLSVDVLYSNQGAEAILPNTSIKVREISNYINFPVMANFYIVDGLTAKAGIQASFFLSATDEITGTSNPENHDLISGYRTMDISLPIGIEYAFDFGLAIEARYHFGLTDIIKTAPNYPNFKNYNSYASLTLGYKF